MRKFVSSVTAVSLAVHMLAGCCAHHAHGNSELQDGDHPARHGPHHADHQHPGGEGHGDHQHKQCDELNCAAVLITPTRSVETWASSPLPPLLAILSAQEHLNRNELAVSSVFLLHSELPVRAHLMLQVLLI